MILHDYMMLYMSQYVLIPDKFNIHIQKKNISLFHGQYIPFVSIGCLIIHLKKIFCRTRETGARREHWVVRNRLVI